MAASRTGREIHWMSPDPRGVLPLDGLYKSRSLRKRIRQGGFEVRIDHDFVGTLHDCAQRDDTWINEEIARAYDALHQAGFAHSVEVWRGNARVGGLYGVRIGGAFFGESMFSHAPDMSKIALVWLLARLNTGGFELLDTQYITPHLARMGAVEIPREVYLARLRSALEADADFKRLDPAAPADQILHLSSQTS